MVRTRNSTFDSLLGDWLRLLFNEAATQVGGRRGVLLVRLVVKAGVNGSLPTVNVLGAQALSSGAVRLSRDCSV